MANSEAERTMIMRRPVASATQPQATGARILVAIITAMSSPISAAPNPRDCRYSPQYGSSAPSAAKWQK